MRSNPAAVGLAALLTMAVPAAVAGQDPMSGHQMAMDGAMGDDSMASSQHMRMTPRWPEVPGDRARADSLVAVASAALAKYQDVTVAEQDGYRMFAPKVKRQRVYHYTRTVNAIKARWALDAAAPTSLLYHPEHDGSLRLVGAMYTAPPNLSLDQLNQRLPLSIAQWHQHINLCMPPGSGRLDAGDDARLSTRDPRFGFRGTIATEAECQAAGGEFHERVFGWMVHVKMFDESSE